MSEDNPFGIDWNGAWPPPDEGAGDGSQYGESDVNDGRPGAANDGTVPRSTGGEGARR